MTFENPATDNASFKAPSFDQNALQARQGLVEQAIGSWSPPPALKDWVLPTAEAAGIGAVAGAAIGVPLTIAAVGPSAMLMGGVASFALRGSVGLGMDMALKACATTGLRYGLGVGAGLGVLAYGGYKAYEYFHDR